MTWFKKILKYRQKVVTDDQPIASYCSSQQIFHKKAIKVEEIILLLLYYICIIFRLIYNKNYS